MLTGSVSDITTTSARLYVTSFKPAEHPPPLTMSQTQSSPVQAPVQDQPQAAAAIADVADADDAVDAADAVTTSYRSAQWRKNFEDAKTEEEADAVNNAVKKAVLVWNRGLRPSSDSVALQVRVPTSHVVAAKDTCAGALNVKQLCVAAKTPITPVLDGVVVLDAKEETAIRNLAGPLLSGARVSSAAVAREEAGTRITHAAFFLGDGKNSEAFTYGFVELSNGVPNVTTAVLVCGKESPTRQTDACTAAAAEPSRHFVAQFERADGAAKTLAAWWVATVNAYVAENGACSLPSEPSANRLLDTLTLRMDAYRLWIMRTCLTAKLLKAAMNRINEVVPQPPKRRSKKTEALAAKTNTAVAKKKSGGKDGALPKATSKKPHGGQRGASKKRIGDGDGDGDGDGEDEEDEDDEDGNAGPSSGRRGGSNKRLRTYDGGDDDDDDDEAQPNTDNYYGLTDIRQCGTVFMPAKSGDGPLYTREQIDDCLKDATQMFLYAACTGQKVSIVLGDSKKTTRVFDTFSRRT